ncbi:radical SAM protein [Chloroflexota bacterium]
MPDLDSYSFDIGPIRPPSEAYSLLIRATRNCPWNRCEFCAVYKGKRFQLRTVEEIKGDIETARAISKEIRELAEREGYGGGVREAAAMVYNHPRYNESVRSVALWLYFGAESAFLQDANSLVMRTPELLQVLIFLKESLPSLNRITSYGRSKTAAKKSIEEMKEIYNAGLSRLHLGLETGYDELLSYTQKGVTAEEQIRGGINVREAGISLSEYVMPGLGGKKWSREHAEQTARVLNEINPDYIRLRTTRIREGMPLLQKIHDGEFELQTEDEVVEEIGIFVEGLNCRSELKSDHIINLLPEVEGNLPQDKEKILAVINRYLALPYNERLNYQLGRRAGLYERLDELYDDRKHENVELAMKRIEAESPGGVAEAIENLKSRMM